MSAREPAHPLEKRDLLHAEAPHRARVTGIAERLGGEGRWPEGIDYLEVVKDEALLAKAQTEAVATGSAWLLSQVERISGKKCDPAQWEKLSEAAARLERWRDAVRALSLGGQSERAEALRLEKCPDYDPFKPLGK